MCRAVRALGAILVWAGISLALRWIPSELNVADAPSRRGIDRRSWRPPPPAGGPRRAQRSSAAPQEVAHGNRRIAQAADHTLRSSAAPSRPAPGLAPRRTGAVRQGLRKARERKCAAAIEFWNCAGRITS